MWIISTTWNHTPTTPPGERLSTAVCTISQQIRRYSWYQVRGLTSEAPVLIREPDGWKPLAERTLEVGEGAFLRTRGGERGANLTFFEYDRRRRLHGTCTFEIHQPLSEQPSAEEWGKLLEKLTAACGSLEAVALKMIDLPGWQPGMDGFAPGRYTYLRRNSLHHPRMGRLGFPAGQLGGGVLYQLPEQVQAPARQMLEWSRL